MDPGHPPSAREQLLSVQINADSSEKMYSCSFCKKGFLNAQALGGHMNIHRKDRAKLIMQSRDHNPNPVHDHVDVPVPGKTSTADDSQLQHAEHYAPPDDDLRVGTLGLQSSRMLVESVPLMKANDDKVSDISPEILLEDKKICGDLMLEQNSFPLELDLELRLGHDPHRV